MAALNLKAHQLELLRHIVGQRIPVAVDTLDGRTLRPLKSHELVVERQGYVSPTELAERLVQQDHAPPTSGQAAAPVSSRLSEQQEETLRYLLRQTAPVPAAHLDGRVLRALRARGLVEESDDWVSPSEAGRVYFERHVARERRRRQSRDHHGGSARAEAILRAVEQLESVIPRNAELVIGDIPAYADDALAGLRRLAREMGMRPIHP